MNPIPRLPLYALLAGATMWGVTWWPMQTLRGVGIGGVALTLVSTGAAALILLPFAWTQRHAWREDVPAFVVILVLGGYANLAYAVAIMNGNPVRVMMLFYLAPIWALLGARVFLHERLDGLRMLAVLTAILGAVLTLGGPQLLNEPPSGIDLLAISAGFSYAMNNLGYRHAQSASVNMKNATSFIGAFIWSLLLWPLVDVGATHIPTGLWWYGIVFGLLWYLPAVGLTQFGVSHLDAVRSAILLTLELPIAAVTAWMIAGIVMTPLEMAGGFLIMVAALLDSLPRTARSSRLPKNS